MQSQSNEITPLELLNLYFSDGKSTSNKQSKLCQRFNRLLTWDSILNKDYQLDLCPLLYYILTKWIPAFRDKRLAACGPANPSNANNALNSINSMNYENPINSSEPSTYLNPYYFNSSILSLPNNVKKKLRSHYYSSFRRNMLLLDELDRVLKAFNEAGIEVIVLKGAALAQTVYPDIALRPMGDVDLLIRERDSNRIRKLLYVRGYELQTIARYSKDYIRGYTFHLPALRQRIQGFNLDLHWDFVVKPSTIDIDDIWKSATTKKVANITIFQMFLEDLLLYLCWHSSKHLFARLIWLCDISQIIRVYGGRINWKSLIEKTKRWGIRKFTYYSLHKAKELFDAGVPTNVLDKLKPGAFEIRVFRFISSKTGFEKCKMAPPNSILLVFMHLLSRDRAREKIWIFCKYSWGALLSRTKYIIRNRFLSHNS